MNLRLLPALVIWTAPLTVFGQDSPAAPPAATAAAEKRTLVFIRPETKGAKYEFSSKASLSRTIDYKVEDEVRPGGSLSIDTSVEGALEITEVSPKAGNVTGYTFKIKKMTLSNAGAADEGLEAGTVVTAKLSGSEPVFHVNGGEVIDDLKEALGLVLPQMSNSDEPDEGAMTPPGPVAPGEKWDQDKKKIAESIKKSQGSELDPEKSKATVGYKGPATVSGLEADTITVETNSVYTKIKELPDDAKLNSCEMTVSTTFALPRDVKIAMPLSARSVMESRTRFTAKHDGKEYEADYKTNLQVTQTAKPAK